VQHFGLWQRGGWSNAAFRPALSDPQRGAGAVYKVLSDSWEDQYAWGVTYAMDALSAENPLRMALEREFAAMTPGQISSAGYTKLGRGAAGKPLSLGWATVDMAREARSSASRARVARKTGPALPARWRCSGTNRSATRRSASR
jgi:hypothetical protein